MAKLPPQRANDLLKKRLELDLALLNQGKVRDIFTLGKFLLIVSTDSLSIFDIVLGSQFMDKGKILNALSIFWLKGPLSKIPNHLVAFGKKIDDYLPPSLRNNKELWSRGIIVSNEIMKRVECVVRGYLTGSGWKSYQANGTVCGHVLPKGLWDGAKLPHPIFTPTTKSENGHDIPMEINNFRRTFGRGLEIRSLAVFEIISDFALQKGIIFADSKFEWSDVLADEVATPDSARFWGNDQWAAAALNKKPPTSYDKEIVRSYGKKVVTPFKNDAGEPIIGLNNLDPENLEHVDYVQSLKIPEEILQLTRERYHEIFKRLTGLTLAEFEESVLFQ